ncbi:VOC family protein [Longibacter sp.]|uniref:VOC family protein n=1 Tax=Longibacter sp. TaxID=2045415 RepID=UPI003EBAE6FD
MTVPNVFDAKPFVPALDFATSLRFYTALGWRLNWKADGLAELEVADARILLQDFYVDEWAQNWMLYVTVDDAAAWYEHARNVIEADDYAQAKIQSPKKEPYGAIVTYVWDPSGVLIHFAQSIDE